MPIDCIAIPAEIAKGHVPLWPPQRECRFHISVVKRPLKEGISQKDNPITLAQIERFRSTMRTDQERTEQEAKNMKALHATIFYGSARFGNPPSKFTAGLGMLRPSS